jgi:hypothetical protein
VLSTGIGVSATLGIMALIGAETGAASGSVPVASITTTGGPVPTTIVTRVVTREVEVIAPDDPITSTSGTAPAQGAASGTPTSSTTGPSPAGSPAGTSPVTTTPVTTAPVTTAPVTTTPPTTTPPTTTTLPACTGSKC